MCKKKLHKDSCFKSKTFNSWKGNILCSRIAIHYSISPDSCQECFGMISDRFAKDSRFRALHHTLLI